MRVGKKVWLLAAISIPLTLFTIVLWWGWVNFMEPTQRPVLGEVKTKGRHGGHGILEILRMKQIRKDEGFEVELV